MSSSSSTGVVIVGGGPAGLALALTLVQLHGHKDVTVLEKRPSFTSTAPDRSYVYMVDGRSRKLLDELGLSAQLDDIGVRTTSLKIMRVFENGSVKRFDSPGKDESKVAHLMPRSVLLDLLVRAAQKEPAIHLVAGAICTAICRETGAEGQSNIIVDVQQRQKQQQQQQQPQQEEKDEALATDGATPSKRTFKPQLLVGCDGQRSAVRAALVAWQQEDDRRCFDGDSGSSSTTSSSSSSRAVSSSSANGASMGTGRSNGGSGRFQLREVPCSSSGLRFKVLMLPPNPRLTSGEVVQNHMLGVVMGTIKPLRLSMFPVQDPNSHRPAVVVTPPDHELWDITDAGAMYDFFARCWPQLDVQALVPHAAMAAFAASPGGAFPVPACADGCAMVLGERCGGSGGCGALLLGDALHSFPPDLAQGVNSALEDVHVFSNVLKGSGGDLMQALMTFEERRMPDAQALVQLLPLGLPQQYTQGPIMRQLNNMYFISLILLHKLAPALFAPPVLLQVQDASLSYSTILQRTKDTRRRLIAVGAVVTAATAAVAVHKRGRR